MDKSPTDITINMLIQELKQELLPVLSVPKRYLTEGEAGHYLNVSVHSLRKWRGKGERGGPPYLRIGTCIRYDVRSLDDWMEQFQVSKGE